MAIITMDSAVLHGALGLGFGRLSSSSRDLITLAGRRACLCGLTASNIYLHKAPSLLSTHDPQSTTRTASEDLDSDLGTST